MGSLLVGDFGGTNARLAIAADAGLDRIKDYSAASFENPGGILRLYTEQHNASLSFDRAVIAVASSCANPAAVQFQNGPWKDKRVSFEQVRVETHVINDFVAEAYAVTSLTPGDCSIVAKGREAFFPERVLSGRAGQTPSRVFRSAPEERFLILGPGTGLGVATGAVSGTGQLLILGGEGGHGAFAPANKEELSVVTALTGMTGRAVTHESIASGTGLVNTFKAFARLSGWGVETTAAEKVVQIAQSGEDAELRECAQKSLKLFARALGQCAANAALTNNVRGGIFLTGGMLRKMGNHFDRAVFTDAVRSNDLVVNFMNDVPVLQIQRPDSGLHGARAYARMLG